MGVGTERLSRGGNGDGHRETALWGGHWGLGVGNGKYVGGSGKVVGDNSGG